MNTDSDIKGVDLNGINKIVTLGPKGTFSNQAASKVGGNHVIDIQYTTTIPQIASEVVLRDDALGVLPVENSTSGIVGPAQDSLVESNVVIVSELLIDVRYSLLANGPLDQVKTFFCHSVAFNQTMSFTSKHLPRADVVFSNSNIHSGEMFLERSGQAVAAIIPSPAAHENELFRKSITADDVQDYKNNMTRFFVIKRKPENYVPDFTHSKTSIFVVFNDDRHSLLFELLREFHVFGVNLCRLESRPTKDALWSYSFFIDLINNHRSEACLKALKDQDIDFQVFGSYNTLET